ncbi:hypothetical protein EPN44_13375 [bacterium]|nr:MAG: hypothetical protein EPN44_13375 [bacterium]
MTGARTEPPNRASAGLRHRIAGVTLAFGSDDERVAILQSRRYRRMQADDEGSTDINAFTVCRTDEPYVVIDDDVVRCCRHDAVAGERNFTPELIEGRAMLEVNRRIFARRPELVVCHAGALVIDRKAVVIAGPSRAGKSTLTLSLLLAVRGHRMLSDEFALINIDEGTVEAFPRLLSARAGTRRSLGLGVLHLAWDAFDPTGIFVEGWAAEAPIGEVFILAGRDDYTRIRRLGDAEAMLALLPNVMGAEHGLAILDKVEAALKGATVYELVAGPPQEAAAAVLEIVQHRA